MRTHDLITSLFWLGFALVVCLESLHLGIGTIGKPGAGLMAFGSSLILAILSLSLFLRATLKKRENKTDARTSFGVLWKRAMFVVVGLLIYANFVTTVGYLLSTFILMSFLFWIVKERKEQWWWVFGSSFLTTIITYYVFSKLLGCQLPYGLLEF